MIGSLQTLRLRNSGHFDYKSIASERFRCEYHGSIICFQFRAFKNIWISFIRVCLKIDLIASVSAQLETRIGIIPELKHAGWHNRFFYNASQNPYLFEDLFMKQLQDNGYPLWEKNPDRGDVIVQNFEEVSARYVWQLDSISQDTSEKDPIFIFFNLSTAMCGY